MIEPDYYLSIHEQRLGPYSMAQIRAMWLAGQVTAEAQLLDRDLPPQSLKVLQSKFEQKEVFNAGRVLASILGLLGFTIGGCLALYALSLFGTSKSAWQDTTAAVILGTGLILGLFSPLLAICACRR